LEYGEDRPVILRLARPSPRASGARGQSRHLKVFANRPVAIGADASSSGGFRT
jgi:hypothetical protein